MIPGQQAQQVFKLTCVFMVIGVLLCIHHYTHLYFTFAFTMPHNHRPKIKSQMSSALHYRVINISRFFYARI